MKNFFTGLLLIISLVSFQLGCAQTVSQNAAVQKSIAVVLKFSGKNGMPEQVEVYSKNTFTGNLKNLKAGVVLVYTEPYRLKFFNETGELIYSEENQNPLKQSMESGSPEGALERNEVVNKTGYANIRFRISENVKNIKAACYKINGLEEIEISTLNIAVQ